MALRNIVKEGDGILAKVCRPVENFNSRLHILLDDMAETMNNAGGVGLAGPQVGILRRVAVVDVGDGLIELVNPVILEKEGEQRGTEGCLSCPGEYGITIRPMKVKIKAQNRDGEEFIMEAEEFKARAFCHEIDHLDGILFKQIAVEMLEDDEEEYEEE